MKKKVMVFGTFDYLHEGHEYFLKEAKKHGDFLLAVVARDRTVAELKGKRPAHSEKERLETIVKSGIADKVLLGRPGKDRYKIIEKIKPDVICLGYDQRFFAENLESELKKRGLKPKVIRLGPYKPETFKSSLIAKK